MQNTVIARLSGGGKSSLSSITGIGAGTEPFRAAEQRTVKRGFTLAEVLIINWYIDNYKTYSKSRNVATDYFDDGQIVLTDGSFYMIENPDNSTNYLFITVDVNGYSKKTECLGA